MRQPKETQKAEVVAETVEAEETPAETAEVAEAEEAVVTERPTEPAESKGPAESAELAEPDEAGAVEAKGLAESAEPEDEPENPAEADEPEDELADPADDEFEDAPAEEEFEEADGPAGPAENPEAPKKGRKRKRRRSKRAKRLTVLAVIVALAAVIVLANLPYFNVQNVSVIGNKWAEDAEIKRLAEMDDEQSLIGLNSLLAPHKIKVNPYIDKVNIRRIPPDTIEIIVTEKEPIAQVATEEKEGKPVKYVAVYDDTTVLEISDDKMDIPYIKDVNVTEAKLKSKVKVEKQDAFEKGMKILETARENDMFFKRVTVEGTWVDTRIYGDIYCVGRYKNIIDALESGNLRMVVYRLYQKNTQKGTINVADNAYCSFTPKT